ncbi:MAG TPA: DUF3313 domain-containing protein [Ensifer sp.]|uniref:DUF3313 domain-containing protein n=1 Tax=Ensifer sp. TaxID=1872086 RepID=UPI002E13FB57|nr:DUF3313 domain-containing protein [Ensifer sp.]
MFGFVGSNNEEINSRRVNEIAKNVARALIVVTPLYGCTSVPLKEGGTLTSYSKLSAPTGKFEKKRTYFNKDGLRDVRTVSIAPTSFTMAARERIEKQGDRLLVSNAIDRAVCFTMSEKYQIVPFGTSADLTIRTVITDIVPTQAAVAGAAKAISIGSSLALPVSVPRLPIGLGGLAVEAEAVDRNGVQSAAIVWSKGANSFTSEARVSEIGDAYDLAAAFGSDFSRMVVAGKEPGNFDLRLPSVYDIRTSLGGKPGSALCENFGRSPGVIGMLGASLGTPPSWTDKGARSAASAPDTAISTGKTGSMR